MLLVPPPQPQLVPSPQPNLRSCSQDKLGTELVQTGAQNKSREMDPVPPTPAAVPRSRQVLELLPRAGILLLLPLRRARSVESRAVPALSPW